jgi:aldehyde:ferredoxin oxidoreductase
MTEEKRQAFGYMGKILHVDLSLGKTWTEEPNEAFYRTYLGGAGLIGYYLLKEVPAHADPLGPDNRLIFSAGVISGTPIGGAGRHSVGAKSPISGGYGKAEVGGYWGAELKHAGWDAIVIQGKARKPVYLTILDDRAEIHDASKLWGLEVLETENAIKAELGDKQVRVSSIGPAGENLVRFACIISDRRSAAGRCGLGAVMGSKNLKAVAVRGRSKAPIADEKTFKQLAKSIVERVNSGSQVLRTNGTGSFPKPWMEAGGLPINNFRDGLLDNIENNCAQVMRDRNYNIGMDTCFACPTHCKKVLKIGEPWNVIPEYGGLEYETLAALASPLVVRSRSRWSVSRMASSR